VKDLRMRIGNDVRKRTGNGTWKNIGDEIRKEIGEVPRKGIRNETHDAIRKLAAAVWNKKALTANVMTEYGKRWALLARPEELWSDE
jgi:hypothetical protein